MNRSDDLPVHIATAATHIAEQLNQDCFCIGTDVPELQRRLQDALCIPALSRPLSDSHPHLFASAPVFVAAQQVRVMRDVIAAIESVVALPQWQQAALAQAPAIAHLPQATRGVFMGYDFHLEDGGARLIEINTNAGGILLNVALLRAQQACCTEVLRLFDDAGAPDRIEQDIVAMFREEWRLARGDRALRTMAIVDSDPEAQYLYPEFLLFQRLLGAAGINTLIADPKQLAVQGDRLMCGDERIDLVYNRLTDFYLEAPVHASLRAAYETDAVVITPHPRAHALRANKHLLHWLADADRLRGFGVPEDTIATLIGGIPRTLSVRDVDAVELWAQRKHWFFKPAAGFGSRGSYRGDKLTRKVFEEIIAGDYVAQALVPPSERTTLAASGSQQLKLDIRHYAYAGAVQVMAARLYQGQTTNFRTAGGGFAPVYQVPDGFLSSASNRCVTAGLRGIEAMSKCATAATSS